MNCELPLTERLACRPIEVNSSLQQIFDHCNIELLRLKRSISRQDITNALFLREKNILFKLTKENSPRSVYWWRETESAMKDSILTQLYEKANFLLAMSDEKHNIAEVISRYLLKRLKSQYYNQKREANG